MKRITSLFLVLVMLFSLTVTAFAQSITPTADVSSVKKGEQVKVTMAMEEEISGVLTAEFRLTFDDTLFTYEYTLTTNETKATGIWIGKPDARHPSNCAYITYSNTDAEGGSLTAGQQLATLVFTAKEDVTAAQTATFTSTAFTVDLANGDAAEDNFTSKAVSVTVTPTPAYEGYAVTAVGPTDPIAVGDPAQVTLKVENSDANVTTYNAYYMTVTYDTDLLTYTGNDAAITGDNGTLTIAGYGNDKTCGSDNIVLSFTGRKVGEAKVTVTSAKVDVKENANAQDAPAATVLTNEVTVNVGSYKVTLPEGFTGSETITSGEDYTFTADNKNYDYTFTVTVGADGSADVTDNKDGTYIISKDQIKGNLNIQVAAKTGKTRTVTVGGNAAENVTYAPTATYGTDYTFTITKTLGYTYSVNATAGGEAIGVTEGDNGSYTIKGEALTGDVVITVNKTHDSTMIKFEGTGAADVAGGTSQPTGSGEAFTFTLNKQPGYTYEVKLGDEVLTPNSDGSYTIPAEKVIGETLTVTVNATAPAYTVNASGYVTVDGGKIWLITATCDPSTDDTVLTYGGNAMYWSSKYNDGAGAYAWLVFSEEAEDEVVATAKEAISIASGEKTLITYDGDVNMTSGTIDINDAQLVWNMYSALYKDFNTVSMQKFLKADMTGDGKLDTADAAVIVGLISE